MDIAQIIGRNIEKFIKESSMSNEECSKLIGVTRQTLNNYIKGDTAIDSAKLFVLAKHFNKSIIDFMTDSNIESKLSFMFRADNPKKNFTDKDYNYINNQFNRIFEVLKIAKLDKVIVTPESYKINLLSKKLSKDEKEIIKEIADRERKSLGLVTCNLVDVIDALENKNINIISLDYDNLDLDAISAYSKEKGAFIFINDSKSIPEERKLFSLVHEYAHLIIHRELYSFENGESAYESSRKDINEKVANTFASYFLIDRAKLMEECKKYGGYFDLQAIFNLKKKFQVSAMALLVAMKEGDIIKASIYGYLVKQLKDAGYVDSEPQPIEYCDKNIRLQYLLRKLYMDGLITSNMVKSVLDLDMYKCRALVKQWEVNG